LLSRFHITSITRGFKDCQEVFEKSFSSFFLLNSYSDPAAGLVSQQKSAATKEPQKTTPAVDTSGGC
jgi:hypothetical protein